MMRNAEIGIMQPQTKERLESPPVAGNLKKGLSPRDPVMVDFESLCHSCPDI